MYIGHVRAPPPLSSLFVLGPLRALSLTAVPDRRLRAMLHNATRPIRLREPGLVSAVTLDEHERRSHKRAEDAIHAVLVRTACVSGKESRHHGAETHHGDLGENVPGHGCAKHYGGEHGDEGSLSCAAERGIV